MNAIRPVAMLPPGDHAALAKAVHALENPSFAVRMAEATGQPVNRLMSAMPKFANRGFEKAVEKAILNCLNVAIDSMDDEEHETTPSIWVPRVIAGVTGGLAGMFGLFTLPLELPLTTSVILRSIAEIARGHGEDLTNLSSRLACLEVFALGGGRGRVSNGQAITYYATRATLNRITREMSTMIARQGVTEATTSLMARVAAIIAARFSPVVAERFAVTAMPIAGLIGGATVNVVFTGHYQQMAHGHFAIRALERRHGYEVVQWHYDRIAANGRRTASGQG